LGPLSRENPLVDTYFTRLPMDNGKRALEEDERALANNGWIWNADPLVNFAAKESKAYLRREVIAWGDCVKLNYGEKPV
jgi:glycogen debranching enzyme